MVNCDSEATIGAEAPDALETLTATSTSSYSVYKQRIDSMFDDTRSSMPQASPSLRARTDFAADDESSMATGSLSRTPSNVVQERIENMFAEMSAGQRNGSHRFPVEYLGSVPLVDKVTNLKGLQDPLKDLYFGYRRDETSSPPIGQQRQWEPGFLEISDSGLKVLHRERREDSLGKVNPFPTIAVWAAVKFVCRETSNGMQYAFLPLIADPGGVDKEALFRSLTASEEKIIRSMKSILRACNDKDTSSSSRHAPMFAVVMRKMGVSRQLECHGFLCSSSEEAIVMAANLYQALMASMQVTLPGADTGMGLGSRERIPENGASTEKGVKRPIVARMHHEDGVGRVSVAGSVCGDPPPSEAPSTVANSDAPCRKLTIPGPPKIPPPVPKRPPRRKKSGSSSKSDDGEDLMLIETTSDDRTSKKSGKELSSSLASLRGSFPSQGNKKKSSRESTKRQSTRATKSGASESNVTSSNDTGDILTKVAIPRSHSFLNANGPHMRYSRKHKSDLKTNNPEGEIRICSGSGAGGSPLGFNELFMEFRQQEGLDSLDDILSAIIDAEGMSFNDLKPIYKEFLLKLALTLTKDELYQRSKNIMRRQRKRQMIGRSGRKRRLGLVVTAAYIKRAVRKSITKLRPKNKKKHSRSPLTPLIPTMGFKGLQKPRKKLPPQKLLHATANMTATSTSMSSYPSSNFKMSNKKQPTGATQSVDRTRSAGLGVANSNGERVRRRSSRRRSQESSIPRLAATGTSTSEDSDFFTMIRCSGNVLGSGAPRRTSTTGNRGNRSSSGYVSYSDCSYDSESCTCVSAERCYCSMNRPKHRTKDMRERDRDICPCDTDSCKASAKCYCSHDTRHSRRSRHGQCQRRSNATRIDSIISRKNHANRRQRHHPESHQEHIMPPPANIFEQLKQQGFAASDSSISRADSPMTAWRNNERHISKAGSVKSSQSLEFLLPQCQYPPSPMIQRLDNRRASRMDMYRTNSTTGSTARSPSPHRHSSDWPSSRPASRAGSRTGGRVGSRAPSRAGSRAGDEESLLGESNGTKRSRAPRKVLVVSARDPKGRVIYMGASGRDDKTISSGKFFPRAQLSSFSGKVSLRQQICVKPPDSAHHALSVKKSAEIAALFTDVKVSQTTDIISRSTDVTDTSTTAGEEMIYSSLDSPIDFPPRAYRGPNYHNGTNLEYSLGYLP